MIDDESDTNVSRSINESGIDKNILEMAQGIEDELDEGVVLNFVDNVDSNSVNESTVASVEDINWDHYMRENYVYDGDNLGDYIEEPSESSVENADEGGMKLLKVQVMSNNSIIRQVDQDGMSDQTLIGEIRLENSEMKVIRDYEDNRTFSVRLVICFSRIRKA